MNTKLNIDAIENGSITYNKLNQDVVDKFEPKGISDRVTALESVLTIAEDSDEIINKWGDVVRFLEDTSDETTLSGLLAAKANISALDNYLPLSGGTMQGNIDIRQNAIIYHAEPDTSWANPRNSGLRILNSLVNQSEEAASAYAVGLSVSGYYGFQLASDGGNKWLFYRSTGDGSSSGDWKTIAFTDSNVASATKLETARTIWGQSFDGTGDVSNHLTGVSYIEFRDTTSSSGIYQGDILGPGLNANDIGIYTPKLYISGNVGIGTTDPDYQLDVNGTAGFTEVITPKLTIGSAALTWLENTLNIQGSAVIINTALGIGINPANRLDVLGTIGCNGLNLRHNERTTSLRSTETGHLTIDDRIITTFTNVTYNQLGSLIVEGTLIPGAKYCIIDYQTTASEDYVEWHPFQIIVTALSNNTLSEEASVKSGDSYFANNDLSAWKVWYCYSNDTSRFEWATADGKGVIYRMIDEFGNDCPYDFKSIKLMKYQAGDVSMNEMWPSAGVWSNVKNAWYFSDKDDANIVIGNGDTFVSISNSEYGQSFFTFYKDGADASLTGVAHDNIMKPNYSDTGAQRINNNVFICNSETYGIVLKEYCYDNLFRNCHSIQLKNSCGYNYFSDSSNINLENNCYHNSIMMSKNINFGNECNYNNFEHTEKVNFLDLNTFNSLRFVEVIDFGIGCSGNSVVLFDSIRTSGVTLGARSMFNSISDVCTNVSLMPGVIWTQTNVSLNNCTIYSTVKGSNEYRINIDKSAAFVSLNQNGTLVYWDDEDSYRIDASAGEIAWNRTTFSYRPQSFTLTIPEASGPAKSHAVISNNNPNTDVVIALPTYYPYINFGEDAITIPSGESVEISVITDGTRYFIRHS